MPSPRYLSSLALLAAVVAGIPCTARAQLKPDGEVVRGYLKADRLTEQDAEQAWQIAQSLPPFEHADDVRLRLLSDAAIASGRATEAAQWLTKFADDPHTSHATAFASRLDAAEMLLLAGKTDEATELLKDLVSDRKKLRGRYSTRRHLSARALRLLHDVRLGSKDERGARSLARTLLVQLPAEVATRREGLALDPAKLGKSDRFARGKALYNAWAYEEARAELEPFERDTRRGQQASWLLAEIALNKLRDDFPRAERLFSRLSKENYRGPEALFSWGRALMRQERYDETLKRFDEYVERYPRGPHVELIYYYRGWLPYDHRDNEEAIRGLKAYVDRYGRRGRRSSYIYGFLAWTYMRMERWKEAIEVWNAMLPFGNPIVAGKALYWKAFARHKLKDDGGALSTLAALRKRYPVSYYGVLGEQLRATIKGGDPRASKVWWPEGAGSYDDAPRVKIEDLPMSRLSDEDRAQLQRVMDLVALGEDRLARDAIEPIDDRLLALVPASERNEWVHALGRLVGNYHAMWRIGGRSSISYLPPIPPDDKLLSVMAYPRAYEEVVTDVAGEFELPPYLMWAIMRQESRYKPSAISHTDAVGALQMIPKTARLVADDLGIEYNPRTFHHPEVGFRFSGFYMRKLLDTFGGLYTPMTGAYNSGPQVIARWFRRNPEASFPWLIEEFEYNEGRAYARKVTEHLVRYVFMYEQDKETRDALFEAMFPLSRDIDLAEDVGY